MLPPWFLTIVYGSPHFSKRESLWDDSHEIHSSVTGPWAIMGGYNATLHDFERAGPPLINA